MRPYVIGVDAGGTKTSVCAFDLEGQLIYHGVGAAANFSENPMAWKHVEDAVDTCIEVTEGQYAYIAVGASGICGAGMEKEMQTKLQNRYHCQSRVVDDGRLALQAKLRGRDGVLVISGTGSVAYGKVGRRLIRTGGWGLLLDDRGSGTAIVLEAFRGLAKSQDEGRSLTAMEKGLLEQLGCPSPYQLPGSLHRLTKAQLAALAPIVIEHGKQGEEEARKILQEAGRKLAQMGSQAADRLGLSAPYTAVSGSILEKCELVSEAFFAEWFERFPDAKLAAGEERVEKGALWYYREEEIEKE